MLKNYLNNTNAIRVFGLFSLFMILCYAVSLTLFITMPPEHIHSYLVFKSGLLILEYIFASVFIAVLCLIIISRLVHDQK